MERISEADAAAWERDLLHELRLCLFGLGPAHSGSTLVIPVMAGLEGSYPETGAVIWFRYPPKPEHLC